MRIGKTSLSKRTLALLAAAALLLGGGGFAGTRAALTYYSNDYRAAFELEHLQVHLIENGRDVCEHENQITSVHRTDDAVAKDKTEKYRGNLLMDTMGYENSTHRGYGTRNVYQLASVKPGTVVPGKTYTEEIKAGNSSNVDEYVRLTIRKYWVKDAGKAGASKVNGLSVNDAKVTLDPSLIKLTYNGEEYNKSAWQRNDAENEGSEETETYYLTNVLKGKGSEGTDHTDMNYSEPLFNELTIDLSIAGFDKNGKIDLDNSDYVKKTTTKKDNVTVTTYEYIYDGYTFFIEADVQAIQTHHANDAVKSLWGVQNVTAENGIVTVK